MVSVRPDASLQRNGEIYVEGGGRNVESYVRGPVVRVRVTMGASRRESAA